METADDTTGGESKACADCHTTKTPLWRGGPEGPKSLCNACGIRYRKRRRQALGLDANEDQQLKKKAAASCSSSNNNKDDEKKTEGGDKKKKEEEQVTVLLGFGPDVGVLKQRRRMRRNKCLSEEERAAVLLMALSSGVIYAS